MATAKTTVVAKKPEAKATKATTKATETKKATVTKTNAGTTKVAPAKKPTVATPVKATTAKAGTTKVAPAKATPAKPAAKAAPAKPAAKAAPAKAASAKVVTPKVEEKKAGATVYHVSKRGESKADREWKVFIQGSTKVIKLFDTQKEALDYALDLAENKDDGSYVLLHGLDGKMRKY